MKTNNDWRYVSYNQTSLDTIHNYNPEDEIIDRIDGRKEEEQSINFSFHALLEDGNKLLTRKQKLVLYKRIVEGKTFAQIGKECKTTRQNCFEIYNKALSRLKEDTSWLSGSPSLKLLENDDGL